MNRASIAAVLFLVPLVGEARAQQPLRPTGACQAVWVKTPDATATSTSRSRRNLDFSAAEVLDLEFLVFVPADGSLSGRSVEVKLFTPKGHLYQTLALPVGRGSGAKDATAEKRRARYQTITARLPIAGTTIVNNSLYGTWKADAYIEGERTPCAKARSFVLKP